MLRIGAIGKWHVHAAEYAREAVTFDGVAITAVWDDDEARGREWAAELGAEFVPSWEGLLAREDVDAVLVACATNLHRDVVVRAARLGKHIFSEKVMALSARECEEMIRAVREAGVKYCISTPRKANPIVGYAKKLIEDKTLGEVTTLRIRTSHGGGLGFLPDGFFSLAQAGGGAMIDLGAHAMYISRWLLGKPKSVTSHFINYCGRETEDNAVSVMEFENKVVAIADISLVAAPGNMFGMEVFFTKGALYVNGEEDFRVYVDDEDGRVSGKRTPVPRPKLPPFMKPFPGHREKNSAWIVPDDLPDPLPSAVRQWIGAIEDDGPIYFGLEEGLQLTELMDAAYLSARENRTVFLG
jgi:predicted dehydrogenase